MVYKCCPNNVILSHSIIPAAELVDKRIELKIQSIQLIANDLNGSNSLCFRKSFLIFYVYL